MNEIFTVYVTATHYYDEDGKKTACYPEEKSWVDSYWTDEAAALAEAEKLWNDERPIKFQVMKSDVINLFIG